MSLKGLGLDKLSPGHSMPPGTTESRFSRQQPHSDPFRGKDKNENADVDVKR